jgi:hypothetical protein
MTSIRHEAHAAAQKAWKAALDNHARTQRWDPVLVAEIRAAEQWVDDIEAIEAMPEHVLDALHEAMVYAMAEYQEAEDNRLPDVPLAAWSEGEARWAWGNR